MTATAFDPFDPAGGQREVVFDEHVPASRAGARTAEWVAGSGRDFYEKLPRSLVNNWTGDRPEGGYQMLINNDSGLLLLVTWPDAELPEDFAALAARPDWA